MELRRDGEVLVRDEPGALLRHGSRSFEPATTSCERRNRAHRCARVSTHWKARVARRLSRGIILRAQKQPAQLNGRSLEKRGHTGMLHESAPAQSGSLSRSTSAFCARNNCANAKRNATTSRAALRAERVLLRDLPSSHANNCANAKRSVWARRRTRLPIGRLRTKPHSPPRDLNCAIAQ